MHRREFLAGALASPFWLARQAEAQSPIVTADMHFHSFFAQSKYHARPLAQTLAAGNTTLAAWSLVGDLLWFDVKTYKQKSVPKPGEALGWFQRELGRIKEHVASQKLRILRVPPDVDRALRGEPHIVLAVEGASFIEATLVASRPPSISACAIFSSFTTREMRSARSRPNLRIARA